MRAKLSGSIETLEAMETALRDSTSSHLEKPLTIQANTELRFGVKEWGDIIVAAKDFGELVSLCWSGIQILRKLTESPSERPPVSDAAPATIAGAPVTLEVTTATGQVRIAIPLDSTHEQISVQLSPLQTKVRYE
jgi:hypothetical protein